MAGSTIQVDYLDETGQKAVQKFFMSVIGDPEDFAGLVTVLDAISDAAITGIKVIAQDSTVVGTAVDGPYASAEDKMLLIFQGAAGSQYQIAIPAPDETCFMADKETVDPADTAVNALITIIEADCKDPNGGALTYVSGKRTKTYTKQQ